MNYHTPLITQISYDQLDGVTQILIEDREPSYISIDSKLPGGSRAVMGNNFELPYELNKLMNSTVLTERFATVKDAILLVYFILVGHTYVVLSKGRSTFTLSQPVDDTSLRALLRPNDQHWKQQATSMMPFYKLYDAFKTNTSFRSIVKQFYLAHPRGQAPATHYKDQVFDYLERSLDAWLQVLDYGSPINRLYATPRAILVMLGDNIPFKYYKHRLIYMQSRVDPTQSPQTTSSSIKLDDSTAPLLSKLPSTGLVTTL
jgi:hypothetical protein